MTRDDLKGKYIDEMGQTPGVDRVSFEVWLANRLLSMMEEKDKTCEWELFDQDTDGYQTSCGQEFLMTGDNPPNLIPDNFKFCVYCGKKISLRPPQEET